MLTVGTVVAVTCGSLIGMTVQRSAGLGFSLIAVPVFGIALGTYEAVHLANMLAVAVTLVVFASTWRGVELRKVCILAGVGALAVIPGVLLARKLPQAELQLFAGAVITLSVLLLVRRSPPTWHQGRWSLHGVGAAAGFLNATAGAGGPPVATYAAASQWSPVNFVPTLQLSILAISVQSTLVKGIPSTSPQLWLLAGIGLFAGRVLGGILARRVSPRILLRIALTIALLGGISLMSRGLLAFLQR